MKTKILLSGCNGKMGRAITALVKEREDCEIAAGVDLVSTGNEGFPVFSSVADVTVPVDVVVDFSHPSLLDALLAFGRKTKTPAVMLCTTGYSKEQVTQSVHAASREIPVFSSAQHVARHQPAHGACQSVPCRCWGTDLTWRLWKCTTIKRLTPPAAQP